MARSRARCSATITQGKRKGEKCNNSCEKGSKKCMYHNSLNNKYKKKNYLDKKYSNLEKKIEVVLNEKIDLLDEYRKKIDLINRKIYGVRLFINDKTLVKNLDYEYIEYDGSKVMHNAKGNIATLNKKKDNLVNEKIKLKKDIKNLKKAKNIFINN